jgi:hypothetical protein
MADFAFDGKAERFEEALDGQIERGFQKEPPRRMRIARRSNAAGDANRKAFLPLNAAK